jgi:putative membrane protein
MDKIPKIDRQREHQANERTFLAWLRTCISLIGFGFAIARFGIFLRQLNLAITQQQTPVNPLSNSENLGLALVIFGILAVALAAWRYNQVFWQIERADYRPNRLIVWIMTGVVIILGLLSIPLLLRRDQVPPRSPFPTQPQSRIYKIPDFFKKSGI